MKVFANPILFLIVVIGAIPFLHFPTLSSKWLASSALVLLGIFLLLRAIANQFKIESPIDIPLTLLLLLLPLNLWASPQFGASLNRAYPLIGALLLCWALAVQREWLLRMVDWGTIVAAGLLLIPILLWTRLRLEPFIALQNRMATTLPTSLGALFDGSLNPNLSAGVLLLFWSPSVMLVIFGRNSLKRLLALPLVLIIPAIILLAGSRGAIIGLFAAAFTLLLISLRRRPLWLIPISFCTIAILAALLLLSRQPASVIDPTVSINAVRTLDGRLELWSRGFYMVQDFPLTGVGLDQVEPVIHVLYPLFLFAPNADFDHLHNIFVHTSAESGIPYLIALCSLLLILLWLLGKRALQTASAQQRMALGLLGTLVGTLVHNLVDTVTSSKHSALIVWAFFGLMVAVATNRNDVPRKERRS